MAVIKMREVHKLSLKDAQSKLLELERAMLELAGEGKAEKRKPLKQAIARLNTHIHSFTFKKAA